MKLDRKQVTTVAITASITAVVMLLLIERADQNGSLSASIEETEDHDTTSFVQDKIESPEDVSADPILDNPVDDISSAEVESSSSLSGGISNFEGSIVNGHAISTDFLTDLESADETFDNLAAEFRNGVSLIGAEHRIKYEGVFSAPLQSQNGSVSLDVLECGEILCIVKYGANNESLLNEYTKNVMTSDDFDAGAILQLHENPSFTPDMSRRYIFSHDPNVSGLSIPKGVTYISDENGE